MSERRALEPRAAVWMVPNPRGAPARVPAAPVPAARIAGLRVAAALAVLAGGLLGLMLQTAAPAGAAPVAAAPVAAAPATPSPAPSDSSMPLQQYVDDGAVGHLWNTYNISQDAGGATLVGQVSSITHGADTHVYGRASNNDLTEYINDETNGHIWSAHDLSVVAGGGAPIGGSPAAVVLSNGLISIFVQSGQGHLVEYVDDGINGHPWNAYDLTAAAGGGVATGADPAVVLFGTAVHVYVRSASGDLDEYVDDGINGHLWNVYDLTAAAGFGVQITTRPSTEVLGSFVHVYAQSTASNLVEFVNDGLGGHLWNAYDQSADAGGGSSLGSGPTSIVYAGVVVHVYVRSSAGDLVEYVPDGVGGHLWNAYDLSVAAGGGVPDGGVASAVVLGRAVHVYTRSSADHLVEYVNDGQGGRLWNAYDQSATAGGGSTLDGDPSAINPGGAIVSVYAAGGGGSSPGAPGWTVYHHDPGGTGADPSGASFSSARQAWASPILDGQLFGEPLETGGVVFVATENDTMYALSANTGGVIWSQHLGTPVPSADLPCGDIGPTVGITSTPVVDPARNEIFVVADELVGGVIGHYLYGLDLSSGAVVLSAQAVDPPGSAPAAILQRAALTLDSGHVLFGYGGNAGDCSVYHGWVVSAPETGGAISTFEVDNTAPGDTQGAVWMGGGAPIVDAQGNIWVATGNGSVVSPGQTYDDSDGVLELTSTLSLVQYFAPSTWTSDNAGDADLGSSTPALLPNGVVFQAGKSNVAFALRQSSLGGIGGQAADLPSFCGDDVDGGEAFANSVVYAPCGRGIVAVRVGSSPPSLTRLWMSPTGSGGPPVIAGGLVWTIGGGTLYGLSESDGSAVEQLPLNGEDNHFPTPSVGDGLLLAPAHDQVIAFSP